MMGWLRCPPVITCAKMLHTDANTNERAYPCCLDHLYRLRTDSCSLVYLFQC
jgi:hypothetical protein